MMDCRFCRKRHTCDDYLYYDDHCCNKFTFDTSLSVDDVCGRRKMPVTNADRFRQMTNEEQQYFVRGFWEIEDFADWLKRPYKEKEE